jgi:MoaA/NifB/PqqE/SkfB family radical SAM enzyme
MRLEYKSLNNGVRCLAGLVTRRRVFGGPRSFSLILSSDCNSRCIMCWFHSPLLGEMRTPDDLNSRSGNPKPAFMNYELCATIIREMHELGAARVILAGWGEPTLHPQFDRILESIVRLRLAPYIITNGLAIDDKRALRWGRLPVHFRFSLHAGDPETWMKIHPHCSREQFEGVERAIRTLAGSQRATVSTMHAIQKANFRHVTAMVEQAHRNGIRHVLFLPVRAEGALAGHVLLSAEEEMQLQRELAVALARSRELGIRTNLAEYIATHRHLRNGAPDTAELYRRIPCYVGWIYTEFDIDGTMRPCENSQIVLGKAGCTKIGEMWRSQPYRRFREEGRSLPSRRKEVTGCFCNACSMSKFNRNLYALLHLKSMKYDEP